MSNAKKSQVKSLLRQVFWVLEDVSDAKMTPRLVRQFAKNHIHHEILEEFALNIRQEFWDRVEQMCWLHIEARKWI